MTEFHFSLQSAKDIVESISKSLDAPVTQAVVYDRLVLESAEVIVDKMEFTYPVNSMVVIAELDCYCRRMLGLSENCWNPEMPEGDIVSGSVVVEREWAGQFSRDARLTVVTIADGKVELTDGVVTLWDDIFSVKLAS